MTKEFKCLNCERKFSAKHEAKCCSVTCRNEYWKKSGKYSGKNNPMYGKKRRDLFERNKSIEQRIACSKANMGRKRDINTCIKIGENSKKRNIERGYWIGKTNPGWKGGISTVRDGLVSYKDYETWRNKVLERDEYRCLMCLREDLLQVHHIIPVYEDKNRIIDVENGATFCKYCHIQLHNPRVRNSNKYLIKYLESFLDRLDAKAVKL